MGFRLRFLCPPPWSVVFLGLTGSAGVNQQAERQKTVELQDPWFHFPQLPWLTRMRSDSFYTSEHNKESKVIKSVNLLCATLGLRHLQVVNILKSCALMTLPCLGLPATRKTSKQPT